MKKKKDRANWEGMFKKANERNNLRKGEMMKFKKPLELMYEKDDIQYLIYIFQGSAGRYKFKAVKAVTVAVRIDFGDEWDTFQQGRSACSMMDDYDVNLGIIKAAGRANRNHSHCDGDVAENEIPNIDLAIETAIKTAKRIDERNKGRQIKPFEKSKGLLIHGSNVLYRRGTGTCPVFLWSLD